MFVLPAVCFFLIFRIYPMFNAFWVSLFTWDLLTPPNFVGISNYVHLFQDELVRYSLQVTTVFAIGSAIPLLILALLVALPLSRAIRGRQVYLVGFFLPVVFSLTVVSIVWKLLYQPRGLFNVFLWTSFQTTADWLSSVSLAQVAMIIMSVWHRLGYYVVIFLAGLQGIPMEYYEAAYIDGATSWKSFRYITLPLLKPTLLFVIIISIITSFQAFSQQFIMTKGGPANATRVFTLLIYNNAFEYLRMGWATTMAIGLFVVLVLFTLVQMRVFRDS